MIKDDRPDPDELLASINAEEASRKRGKLKIFLGMCPGVGKTYAMLQAARQCQIEGRDVLVAVVETHGRKETEALLEGLAVAAKIKLNYRGTVLEEMDLDAILAIRPDLAIVDEFAHTNAPGSRHPKRYQDVIELLEQGIDVFTTLNVQHVESRAEAVFQITGVTIRETVPDSLLDKAEEITLIDLPPEELRERLKEGKVYLGERMLTAANQFFREENLTALREMALRLAAERVNRDLREIMTEQRIQGPWRTGEKLMVGVGPTPFSESLIRWTRRAAAAQNAPWVAVYVKRQKLKDEEEKKLLRNLALARQLGAEVLIRPGTDVAGTLLQVARQNNVTQICIGKPFGHPLWVWFMAGSMVRRLIHESGNIDIHMVRLKSLGSTTEKQPRALATTRLSFQGFGPAFLIVVVVTLLSMALQSLIGYQSISIIYLFVVMVSGIYFPRGTLLGMAATSALLWDFLFVPPQYSFQIYKLHDAILFGFLFVAAPVMGFITRQLRERQTAGQEQENQMNTLYQLTQTLAVTRDSRDAIEGVLAKLEEFLSMEAGVFLATEEDRVDFSKPRSGKLMLSEKERSVASWAFQRKQPAGKFTETLPESSCFYLPLVSMEKSLGILAVKVPEDKVLGLDERSLLESVASLITVSLEKDMLLELREEARLKDVSEKLQTTLLDSVSHELKTPLTVIAGSIEHLSQKGISSDAFNKILEEMRSATRRLLRTVEGLLNMTRLDSGFLSPHLSWHEVGSLIRAVTGEWTKPADQARIRLEVAETLPLVKVDSGILQQALSNLLSNAMEYSPESSEVLIQAELSGSSLGIRVLDQGPGIPPQDLERVFEKFYRGIPSRAGGLGLGLSIAKRFVELHGGQIKVENRKERGACFTITVPVETRDPKKN